MVPEMYESRSTCGTATVLRSRDIGRAGGGGGTHLSVRLTSSSSVVSFGLGRGWVLASIRAVRSTRALWRISGCDEGS